jgi:PhzF family phenazine biosynthesis protein
MAYTMTHRPFQQVDVFTATPYLGNPVAVVLQADGLDDATMQGFARWTNLSETTFLLTPTEPDYRVRIFTPGGELQFAGHPTLGSCHAWLAAGGSAKQGEFVVQQCGVGLVRIRRNGALLAFGAPALTRTDVSADLLSAVAASLGLGPEQIRAAQLLDTVARLTPDFGRLAATGEKVGVAALRPTASENEDHADLEVRGFAPHLGVNEDPVTGSLNASLAQWLIADNCLPRRYQAAQGARLARAGRVLIDSDAAGQVWVGGHAVTCVEGNVRL